MKVIAINGSPHTKGNTAFAIGEVGKSLQEENIDFEIIHAGHKPIRGCMACNKCFENKDGKCIFGGDMVNEILSKLKDADGIIISSPVYYSVIAGTMKSFLDRVFYVASANGGWFRHKVGSAVVAVRRSGGSMTFDSLNHYLNISEMLIPSSNYWNIIHGHQPGEAQQDTEGVQIMQQLGKNMAWMLKMKYRTKELDMEPPGVEKIRMNFIR